MTNNPTIDGVSLLPCPFCGGDAVLKQYRDDGLEIRCTGCQSMRQQRWMYKGRDWLQAKMVETWNNRATPEVSALQPTIAQLQARIGELESGRSEYPECSGSPDSCPENEGFGCCATPSGPACPGDGVNACKKCPKANAELNTPTPAEPHDGEFFGELPVIGSHCEVLTEKGWISAICTMHVCEQAALRYTVNGQQHTGLFNSSQIRNCTEWHDVAGDDEGLVS